MTWDQDVVERVQQSARKRERRQPFDLDVLDDDRCKASSWRGPLPAKPDYENYFGPSGFNRCIGNEGHANHLHKDEWGNVFQIHPDFRVVRIEEAS